MKHDLTKILNHARETRSRRARIDPRKVEAEQMSSSLATFRTEIAQDTVDLLERLLAVQRLARQTLLDAGMPAPDAPLAWVGPDRSPITAAAFYSIAAIDE
jgi:hypothetical protein